MIKILVSTILIFVYSSSSAQEFNIDSIYTKNYKSDKTVYVYMTATWCLPCLDKMPLLDAYFEKKQFDKIMYLFDSEIFDKKKLARIFPFIDFKDKMMLMPKKYYSRAVIQINGHNKMFENFIAGTKRFKPEVMSIDSFHLSSILAIPPSGNPYVFKLPNLEGKARTYIDSFFLSKKLSN